MSYSGVVSIIKTVSESVNPTGIFVHGRKFDASLNFSEADKQIYLYPITADVDLNNHFFESWKCIMGFYFQDAPDSTELNRQALIEQADLMTTLFLDALNEYETISILNVRKEPSYRQMAGTYTGYILSFTLNSTTDLCVL